MLLRKSAIGTEDLLSVLLGSVDLEDRRHRSKKVVCLWGRGIEYVNGIATARDVEYGGIIKVSCEFLSIHCGGRDKKLQVTALTRKVLDQGKQNVCVDSAFVRFVDPRPVRNIKREWPLCC